MRVWSQTLTPDIGKSRRPQFCGARTGEHARSDRQTSRRAFSAADVHLTAARRPYSKRIHDGMAHDSSRFHTPQHPTPLVRRHVYPRSTQLGRVQRLSDNGTGVVALRTCAFRKRAVVTCRPAVTRRRSIAYWWRPQAHFFQPPCAAFEGVCDYHIGGSHPVVRAPRRAGSLLTRSKAVISRLVRPIVARHSCPTSCVARARRIQESGARVSGR